MTSGLYDPQDVQANRREAMLRTGLDFMRDLCNIYGESEGSAIWDRVMDVVPRDVRDGILMMALTGGSERVYVRLTPQWQSNKVGAIKTFRSFDKRKLGLKEAKDLIDELCDLPVGVGEITLQVLPDQQRELRQALSLFGLTVR